MYRPLPLIATVSRSGIHGLGLFATGDIREGDEIGMSHVKDSRFAHGWIRTPLGGFYNHSETPNCRTTLSACGQFLFLMAIRDVESGEELTVKYTLYEVSEQLTNP